VLAYAALTRHLDAEQPVYGLRSRGLAPGEAPHATVEEMAADYVAALRDVQPAGPYRLGGWSMGGVIAYEMARQLERAGEHVETLVLIDAHVPSLHGVPFPEDPAVLVGTFAADMGLPPERLTLSGGDADAGDRRTHEQLYGVFENNLAALHAYRPEPRGYGGAVTLLRAAEHAPAETQSAGWERLARGGVRVHVLPGSHFTLVREPQATALGREVEQCLRPAAEPDAAGAAIH
jgi:thioesterase domain-containing protein